MLQNCLFRIETSSTYGCEVSFKKIGIFNQLVTIVKFVLEKPGKWF